MQFKHQTGFTVIELMVVVAIAAIIAAIAAPSFTDLVNSTRKTSAMSQIVGDLNRARSEAVKRNQRVLICVRSTNTTCGGGTNWQNGWLICYDANRDGACDTTTAANPNPIIVRSAINTKLTLTGSAASIFFNPSGTQGNAATTATLTLNGTWTGATSTTARIAATGNISKTQ